MLNKVKNHNIGIVIASALVFFLMLWFCFTIDGMIENVMSKATYFIALLSAVTSVYSGYGLSRLSVFDKLDDLQERDAALINRQISAIRSILESIIPFSLLCGLIILICGLIPVNVPPKYFFPTIEVRIFIGIFFCFTVASIFLLLLVMRRIFKRINALREQVVALSQTEKKRKALLSKMHEQAEKYPLSEMDFHFKKHKQINP
jgi:hypothetical protein